MADLSEAWDIIEKRVKTNYYRFWGRVLTEKRGILKIIIKNGS